MRNRVSLEQIKRDYDLLLKEKEGRNEAFRTDKYNVYFKPSIFENEIVSKMRKEDYEAYDSGAGGELKEHKNKNKEIVPASMSSIGSSSRFCYLSLKDNDFSAFGISNSDFTRRFEEKLPIEGISRGIPPHMDAYYESEGGYYFFECKCHEQFDDHELQLSDSYFGKGLIVDKIQPSYFLKDDYEKKSKTGKISKYREYDPAAFGLPKNPRFDIEQLLTHVMGIQSRLKSEMGKGNKIREAKLIYFYFIPDAALQNEHIKQVIDQLYVEARLAFESVRKMCDFAIRFELYVFHGDKVETASKNNVKKII